jgi:hypothetical protein
MTDGNSPTLGVGTSSLLTGVKMVDSNLFSSVPFAMPK